jgi:pyrroline-5-carboxylate reductase
MAQETSLHRKVGFAGAGNMARAIAGGIVARGLVAAGEVGASDVALSALDAFRSVAGEDSLGFGEDNAALAEWADIVVLATKPFQAAGVCSTMAPHWGPEKLLISICAGIRSDRLESALAGGREGSRPRVVRVMPNTPALIGAGTAGVAAGSFATAEDGALAVEVFRAVGGAVAVDESKMDLVTGLSGSGPAYVFRFMEVLIEAGMELGLSREEAEGLVPGMVLGSARLALESGKPLHELRAAVTTKGGTTEAGLRVLAEGGLDELVLEAVRAATIRGAELASA